jgi:ribosomal protein S18 acetylase RimI-like enzyme
VNELQENQLRMMEIIYKHGFIPGVEKIIELYNAAEMPRPTNDKERIIKMYENSNVVISAWDNDKLVGVVRCITDFVWYTFLADLAINPAYKRSGIGKKLIELTKEKVGEHTAIILLSVPTAMEYYPKVGFEKDDRAFSIPRKY